MNYNQFKLRRLGKDLLTFLAVLFLTLLLATTAKGQQLPQRPITYTVKFSNPAQVDSLIIILQNAGKYLPTSKMPVDEFNLLYPQIQPMFNFIVKQIQAREAFVGDSLKKVIPKTK